jgi:hypothetical protein
MVDDTPKRYKPFPLLHYGVNAYFCHNESHTSYSQSDPKWQSAEKVAALTERVAEYIGQVAGCAG